jgi:threonine/homoserine/homoserine lactone efflux protein
VINHALFLEFLAAVLLVELTPGPNMAWLTALAARDGRSAGFSAIIGITAGLALHLLIAATGVAALLAAQPALLRAMKWLGVAYMLWLAWDTWRVAPETSPSKVQGVQNALRGFLNNVFNPKALIFYVALLPQFTSADFPALPQMLTLGAIHLIVSIIVHSSLVLLGARLGDGLKPSRMVRRSFAVAIALVALWLAFVAI